MKFQVKLLLLLILPILLMDCKADKPVPQNTDPRTPEEALSRAAARKTHQTPDDIEIANLKDKIKLKYDLADYCIKTAKISLERRELDKYDPTLKTIEDVVAHMKNEKNAIALYEYSKSRLDDEKQKMYFPRQMYLKELRKCTKTEVYLKEIRAMEMELAQMVRTKNEN